MARGKRCVRANRPIPAASIRRLIGMAAALALLSGCGLGGPFAPAPPRQPMVLRPPARTAPRPAPRPATPQPLPDLPATEQSPAAPAGAPVAPVATRVPLPNLARMPAAQVEAQLGAPTSRVSSGTGERWSYRGPGCTLDLFLFPDVGTGGLVVLDRRAGGASEMECLRRMRDGGV